VPTRKRCYGNKNVVSYLLEDPPEYNPDDNNAEEVDNTVEQCGLHTVQFDDHPVAIDDPNHSENVNEDNKQDDKGK
jgi:hypothetical protein